MKALKQIRISVPDGHLATYVVGEGPVVIFLQGGPGDSHDYIRRMAAPLVDKHTCVFFDQRGTGGSSDFDRTPENFRVERLIEDLAAVHDHVSQSPVALVGHSWGAMYGLFASLRSPERFSRSALVSMGPLDPEMGRATGEHLLSALTQQEKVEWQALRAQRNAARDRGDSEAVLVADMKLMRLRVKTWIVNPDLREGFLDEYHRDPPPDRLINKLIWESAEKWLNWNDVASLKSDTWLCVGANDSVPITQFQRLADLSPRIQLTVLQDCGHIPWLEHPREFYRDLTRFLAPY